MGDRRSAPASTTSSPSPRPVRATCSSATACASGRYPAPDTTLRHVSGRVRGVTRPPLAVHLGRRSRVGYYRCSAIGGGFAGVQGGGGNVGKSAKRTCFGAVSLAAGVLAIGLCVSPAAAASGSPRERAALTCQDVYFMGARGSAELLQPGKPGDPKLHGLGPEVHSMAVRVQAVLKAYGVKNFETLSIGYPADDPAKDLTPTKEELDDFTHGRIAAGLLAYYKSSVQRYLGSISEGVTSALSEVVYVHRECPHALLVLAGYSQGAMVMHQVELRLKATHDTAVLRQITGTLLLGDGDRVSHTAAREFGTSTDRSQGIRTYLRHNSGKDIPDPAATANICDSGDIVCDFGIKTAIEWSKGIAIHTSY